MKLKSSQLSLNPRYYKYYPIPYRGVDFHIADGELHFYELDYCGSLNWNVAISFK